MSTVITVENLGKKYTLRHQSGQQPYVALRDVLTDGVKNATRRFASLFSQFPVPGPQSPVSEEFWALKDISFEVKQGDRIGIIGRNGAGKSTLLKILSRITEPTTGIVSIKGRVASLLEVGTGFHPELTGRENIFLNGAILGMHRAEIKKKFDEIVDFAEIEKFLDTPVKRYSSGMYVRLAFAVAAHLEPEILVVDEVLAVGDAQFQKKCLGKMEDVSAKEGRTVLFVSHNMGAVKQLTNKAILLNKGRLRFCGDSDITIDEYIGSSFHNSVVFNVENLPRKYQGTGAAKFISFRYQRLTPVFSFGEPFDFLAKISMLRPFEKFRISMTVFCLDGTPVGNTFGQEQSWPKDKTEIDVLLTLNNLKLAPGHYCCGLSVGRGNHKTGHVDYDVVMDTLHFEVQPEAGEAGTVSTWTRGWGAVVFENMVISIC